MTTILARVKQAAQLPIRVPSIGVASLAYSSAVYASSFRANLLDIDDPWWIVTVGLVLLLSPIYHAFVIRKTAAYQAGLTFSLREMPIESFGDLVVGELVVNALVVLGGMLFLLPGVYVGLRSIYYKQITVLHKSRPLQAIKQSFLLTRNPRVVLTLFLFLAITYCFPLGIDFLLPPTQAWWVHGIAILVSTAFIALVNVTITLSFGELLTSPQPADEPENSA